MGYQSGFLRVIPLLQVDCIRVTHPCAGRRQRYCYLFAAPRLACVRPVASVHPEPGSNSSLYYFFFYNSIENFAFSPSKGAARDSPVLTLTFLLVSYYFVYHSLKDLSPFSSPLLSQCVSVIPEKRVQRQSLSFSPPNIFATFFHLFFAQIHKILITTQLYLNIFLPNTHSFWRESQIYSQNPLIANLFPCSLTSLYNISTPHTPTHPLLTSTHIPYQPPRSSNSPKTKLSIHPPQPTSQTFIHHHTHNKDMPHKTVITLFKLPTLRTLNIPPKKRSIRKPKEAFGYFNTYDSGLSNDGFIARNTLNTDLNSTAFGQLRVFLPRKT